MLFLYIYFFLVFYSCGLQRSSGQYDAELYRSRNYPEQRDRWQFRGHGQFRGGYAGHVTMSPNRGIRFQPPNSVSVWPLPQKKNMEDFFLSIWMK